MNHSATSRCAVAVRRCGDNSWSWEVIDWDGATLAHGIEPTHEAALSAAQGAHSAAGATTRSGSWRIGSFDDLFGQ